MILRYDVKMRQLVFFEMKTLEEYVIYQELRKGEIMSMIKIHISCLQKKYWTTLRPELRSLIFTEKESLSKKAFKMLVKLKKDHAYPNGDFLRNENLL